MESQSEPVSGKVTERRYELLMKLASGGMATVYIGYLRGALGFRQVVAIKRPHAHLLDDPAFRQSFVAEATVASHIHHANVVDVRDVDVSDDSIDLVMDYVEGASLSKLIALSNRAGGPIPVGVAIRIAVDACAGLHAAHETADETGQRMGLVHRDVSPQNILVGVDGVSRVADFGIAKCALSNDPSTQAGTLKGKLGYMAPEYLRARKIDRRADVFAMGAVVWEALMGRRLFLGEHEADTILRVLNEVPAPLSGVDAELGKRLDGVLARALAKDPSERYSTAQELGRALDDAASSCGIHPNPREVAAFIKRVGGAELEERRASLREKLGSRPSALPDDRGEQRETIPERRAARDQGPATTVEYGSANHASSVSLIHGRPRSSRWWLLPLSIVSLIGAVAAVFAVRSSSTTNPHPSDATNAPLAAPSGAIAQQAPSAVLSASASATAPASIAPSASAAPSQTGPKTRPPKLKATEPAVPTATAEPTAPPASTPNGPPPNPYGK